MKGDNMLQYLDSLRRNYILMQDSESRCLNEGWSYPEGTLTAIIIEELIEKELNLSGNEIMRERYDLLKNEYSNIRKYFEDFCLKCQ